MSQKHLRRELLSSTSHLALHSAWAAANQDAWAALMQATAAALAQKAADQRRFEALCQPAQPRSIGKATTP
jgi:hypothetical protein